MMLNGASGDDPRAGARPRGDEIVPIVSARIAGLGAPTSSTPIVRGRDAELARIGAQLDRVRSGVGSVVLVAGEPGMGKTRLLTEAARVARRLALRVGAG